VVLGPSGSGKSTFLRCINLLESMDGGRIQVDGVRCSSVFGRLDLSGGIRSDHIGAFLVGLILPVATVVAKPLGRGLGQAVPASLADRLPATGVLVLGVTYRCRSAGGSLGVSSRVDPQTRIRW
jgi:energy-coupling factor transporter ATP-binding protein EcfA2